MSIVAAVLRQRLKRRESARTNCGVSLVSDDSSMAEHDLKFASSEGIADEIEESEIKMKNSWRRGEQWPD